MDQVQWGEQREQSEPTPLLVIYIHCLSSSIIYGLTQPFSLSYRQLAVKAGQYAGIFSYSRLSVDIAQSSSSVEHY